MQDARDERPNVVSRLLLHHMERKHPGQSPVCGGARLQRYHELVLLHAELLHDSLRKAQEYRFFDSTTTIALEWTQTAFDDSNWNVAVPESVTMQPRGSQYFRKPFNGVADMAAYEIQLKFEYGIIAYINGKEVFREHMPAPESGVITPSTPSSGSFATPAFHGVIRPALEVSVVSSNVLAVELHFSSLTAALLFLNGCTSLP